MDILLQLDELFIFQKAAKPEGGEAAVAEGGDGDANNVSEKKEKGAKGGAAKPKCPFSFCRAQKVEGQAGAEQGQQQPSFQVDMVQRDPAKLQEVRGKRRRKSGFDPGLDRSIKLGSGHLPEM